MRFHAADGSGYAFLADRVLELDPLNPQIAARLLRECARERGDWWAAVGCYHAPNDAARAERYAGWKDAVNRVIAKF